MSFTVTKTQEIDQLPVSPEAKYEIKEILKVCDALGGDLRVTPPSQKLEAGRETAYHFATVTCYTKTPKRFDEIRLSGSGRVELIGEQWVTMWEPAGEKPNIVLQLEGEPATVNQAYFDNRGGVDSVDGKFDVKGIFAYVQRDGKYINMTLKLV